MANELARPAPLSEESFFKARTSRVTFVNPPGYEHYARVRSFGKDYDTLKDYDRNVICDPFRTQQTNRWKTQDGTTGMAVQGRPVK